ncbi:hypothetical protein [Ornithinimicrobium pratense]|uniref:DUF2178 domain-containing protein n=1 Tax=Ornithinimicrobium pratense TaxID=2593973 RepID=A0A5J6V9R9_9MICO|nr:hypothetical protein [Ornithinimicrobium pratense]QFG69951.1 hypothetical protein FY030_15665 [Ornithinimicrobium pratense]
MRSRDICLLAAALFLAGVALLYLADQRESTLIRVLSSALMIIPAGLAANVISRRRRRERREDSPDSVERRAWQNAYERALLGVLVINGLLMLALLYVPGPTPGLWGIAAFAALPVLIWSCYAVELRKLGG